jgi:phosphoglycolate phosphatase-like HAD superfamily hydrolase
VLSQTHRRLIYRPTNHSKILNDPGVTVTLPNEVDYKLKPMEMSDRPKLKASYLRIQRILASTTDDEAWNNLLHFLEGMNIAGERIPTAFKERVTRKAFQQGKDAVIMRAVQDADKTEFRLSLPALTRTIMTGVHRKAADANFKGEGLDSAFKQAETIARLMETKAHCDRKLAQSKNFADMRQSLMVVGTLLELAAARAIDANEGKDVDGKVASYVAKALVLSQDNFHLNATPPDISGPYMGGGILWLAGILPLFHGMKLATKIEGAIKPDLQATFDERFQALQNNINSEEASARENVDPHPESKKEWPLALLLIDQVNAL